MSNEIKIWLFCECEYVAAHSLEEAREWYEKEIRGEPLENDDEVEEYSLDFEINVAEEGEDRKMVPALQVIQSELASGAKLPFILCYDGSCV